MTLIVWNTNRVNELDCGIWSYTMRTVFSFGRFCVRNGILRVVFRPRLGRHFSLPARWSLPRKPPPRPLEGGKILLAVLSPAAFIQLSEEDNGDGKTPEELMLEASRAEIEKSIPDHVHGIRRAWHGLYLFVDKFIFEPIATGFRFLHLVVIFVPVIAAVPIIWFGRRRKDHDNERTGTLWWYRFLVYSMERAGPTFIKVLCSLETLVINQLIVYSLGNGQLQDQTSSLHKCVLRCPPFILTPQPTL